MARVKSDPTSTPGYTADAKFIDTVAQTILAALCAKHLTVAETITPEAIDALTARAYDLAGRANVVRLQRPVE